MRTTTNTKIWNEHLIINHLTEEKFRSLSESREKNRSKRSTHFHLAGNDFRFKNVLYTYFPDKAAIYCLYMAGKNGRKNCGERGDVTDSVYNYEKLV